MKLRLNKVSGAIVAVAALMGLCAFSFAASPSTPHQLVEKVTETLLVDIDQYRQELASTHSESEKEEKIQAFFSEVTETLQPVVDFNWISLNVMGQYRKVATDEQKERFRKAFTQGLVETYGRGLLTYSDQKIEVFPPKEDINGKRKVTVVQEIKGQDQSYPLLYNMALNRKGDWKVLNVIINGINLGSTFRNQFKQSATKYGGDIDKVIDNWGGHQN